MYIYTYIYIFIYLYIHKKTTSNNTKPFVHILVNFFSCAFTCSLENLSLKF